MARLRKQTVDWFSHDCEHKKTMFIIEERFGNDGYAFWFKLLEMIGGSEGHFIDMNKPEAWEYLQAKTRLTEISTTEIMNLLAKLEAIDPELWKEKIVWSENFVDRIAHAYRNRKVEIPVKPDNYCKKSGSGKKEVSEINKERKKERKKGQLLVDSFFEKFCEIFPGPISKTATFKNWEKRIKEGHEPETLIKTAERYKAECEKLGKTEYLYHAHNFLGQKAYYKDYLQEKPESMTEADQVAARFKAELEAQEAK